MSQSAHQQDGAGIVGNSEGGYRERDRSARRRRTAPPRANSIFSAVSPFAAHEQALSSFQIEPSSLLQTPLIKAKYYATMLLKWPSTRTLRALTTQKALTHFMSDLSFALCRQVSRFIQSIHFILEILLAFSNVNNTNEFSFFLIFTLCSEFLKNYLLVLKFNAMTKEMSRQVSIMMKLILNNWYMK